MTDFEEEYDMKGKLTVDRPVPENFKLNFWLTTEGFAEENSVVDNSSYVQISDHAVENKDYAIIVHGEEVETRESKELTTLEAIEVYIEEQVSQGDEILIYWNDA